jgi:hypothetical protein
MFISRNFFKMVKRIEVNKKILMLWKVPFRGVYKISVKRGAPEKIPIS